MQPSTFTAEIFFLHVLPLKLTLNIFDSYVIINIPHQTFANISLSMVFLSVEAAPNQFFFQNFSIHKLTAILAFANDIM